MSLNIFIYTTMEFTFSFFEANLRAYQDFDTYPQYRWPFRPCCKGEKALWGKN
jgi:hypothetical protein